jgi:hypothetical protein
MLKQILETPEHSSRQMGWRLRPHHQLEDPMFTRVSLLASGCVALATLIFATLSHAAESAPPAQASNYSVSGPFVHDNLAVFLIHGTDRLKDKNYLTLQEAMDRKIVIVHETGNVNELSIENVSPNFEVYIQSGDIVKGGRQDRTIAMDFIAPPNSGKMPINAFCVESGRWHQRGGESAEHFASSNDAIAGKSLKLAAKQQMNQGEVWRDVAENQSKLSGNSGGDVRAAQSASSFQLSIESKPVAEHTEAYVKELEPIVQGKDDVIGYAFAINGKINSADVYANHTLFMKLWPKLIKSSAVEALADLQKDKPTVTAKTDDVYHCMADAAKGKESDRDVTPRVKVVTKETDENIVFETRDREAAAAAVHENYVNKK